MAAQPNRRLPLFTPENTKMQSGMLKLQQTINFEQKLCAHEKCNCMICHGGFTEKKISSYSSKFSKQEGKNQNWIQKILIALTPHGFPTLKLYTSDFCFVDGDLTQIFYTDYSTNRVKKYPGTTPLKMLFSQMVRMRKAYKSILEEGFRRSILDKIDPDMVHEKYMEQVLPSHFHNGQESMRLMGNRNCFQKYVLHQNPKYIIDSIEEHKVNENESFCSVKYLDQNVQLFTQKQFETFMILKTPNDLLYVQSYVKQKLESESLFTTEYNFYEQVKHPELFEKAELQVLVMIGGIGKYSEKYEDLDVLEDNAYQLMKYSPQLYAYYSSYRIIHYLAMVSRVYIKHLKMNWILNDIGAVYMQDVFQFQTTEVSLRTLKFRMPPHEHNLDLYRDAEKFSSIYKQLQQSRNQKRQRLQSEFKNKSQQLDPEKTITNFSTITPKSRVLKTRLASINKTIDISRRSTVERTSMNNTSIGRTSLKKPKLLSFNLFEKSPEGRKSESRRISFFQKNIRYRNQTALDKYQI